MLHTMPEERVLGLGATGGPGLLSGGLCCRSFVSKLQSFLLFCSILKVKAFRTSSLLASKYSEVWDRVGQAGPTVPMVCIARVWAPRKFNQLFEPLLLFFPKKPS